MTMALTHDRALLDTIAERLQEARARTFLLVSPLSDEELHAQHDPLMSPIIWDLGHIAHFEELWLTRNLDGPIEFVEMPGLYNPFEHPRSTRAALPLPEIDRCREIMDAIRSRVLARLVHTDTDDANPLVRDGYVFRMVLQHEYQHNETILQTLQLKRGTPYAPLERRATPPALRSPSGGMVRFPGGAVEIGTPDRSEAYDNERPRHVVNVRPFFIDVDPVTNDDYLRFIEAGGYSRADYWSDGGRRWLAESNAEAPKYWYREGGRWMTRVMDRSGPVPPNHPVCHVTWYEAEAFARFAGKRLPTEIEWEAAASWDPAAGRKRRFPWGDEPVTPELANVDQLGFGTAPVGCLPAQRLAHRLLRHDRRCLGMDRRRFPGMARIRGVSVPGVFRSLLR